MVDQREDSNLDISSNDSEIDHRIIGKDMDLFSFHDEAPGFPFYKENFLIIRDELLAYLKSEQKKLGYELIQTPVIMRNDLWVISGHWDYYRENMFWIQHDDNLINVVKPMNCPGGVLVYKENVHSYRELPLKIAEIGSVFRNEQSGAIQGLFRTRGYLMDDAHIYLRKEQIESVVHEIIVLIELIYGKLGFKYEIALSTRPEKSIGSEENWLESTKALENVLNQRKLPYKVNLGEGAFYGPKIDFYIKDSLERKWQCGTIQLDFNLPERFNLNFLNEQGSKEQVIIIHRAILGGVERFIAILLEHFNGKLPLWLAPIQIMLISINNKVNHYLFEIKKELELNGFRIQIDIRDESVDRKIKESINRKINYYLIIGSREAEKNVISVRRRDHKRFSNIQLDDFIDQLKEEIVDKKLPDY